MYPAAIFSASCDEVGPGEVDSDVEKLRRCRSANQDLEKGHLVKKPGGQRMGSQRVPQKEELALRAVCTRNLNRRLQLLFRDAAV